MEVRQSQPLISEASVLDCHLDPILFVMFFIFYYYCRSYAALKFVYCHSSTTSINRVECSGENKNKNKQRNSWPSTFTGNYAGVQSPAHERPVAGGRSQFLTQGKNRVCGSPRSQRSTRNSYNITTGSILEAKKMSLASAARYTWLIGMQAAHERSLFPAQSLHDKDLKRASLAWRWV